MRLPIHHARLCAIPQADTLLDAHLDTIMSVPHGRHQDLVVDYHTLVLTAPRQLHVRDGRVREAVTGVYRPHRLRFCSVHWVQLRGLFAQLDALPTDHLARSLRGMLHWSPPGAEARALLIHGSLEPARLMVAAHTCLVEARVGPDVPVTQDRDWSPAPAFPVRLVPAPRRFHQRYNGDPIRIQVNGTWTRTRLLIGSLEEQTATRPGVDVVLNLGEDPNPWLVEGRPVDGDRWVIQGEGPVGMDATTIQAEAAWVVAQLQANRRTLVHCVAGMNRSATICCATLMLLEGLSAEAALARVRESHPWARPDSYHWLQLRWLAQQRQTGSIAGQA